MRWRKQAITPINGLKEGVSALKNSESRANALPRIKQYLTGARGSLLDVDERPIAMKKCYNRTFFPSHPVRF